MIGDLFKNLLQSEMAGAKVEELRYNTAQLPAKG
jgi:hypothetical protein